MNRWMLAGFSLVTAVAMVGCDAKDKKVETVAQVNLVTTADSVSYLIGKDIANSLKSIKDDIVLDVVFAGMKELLEGKESRINADAERIVMNAFTMTMQQKQMAKTDGEASKNLEEGKKFLEENGKKEGVVTTASGLQYTVIKKGDGKLPDDSARVKVHYEGTLLNGKVFDSSIKRGEPAVFGVNQVIRGWTEALKLMPVGSKYKLFVPSDLAYGRRGMPHDIGPNVMLIFEVELISIEK